MKNSQSSPAAGLNTKTGKATSTGRQQSRRLRAPKVHRRSVWRVQKGQSYEVHLGIKMVQWFKNAGFVDIRVENFVVLYGVWPKTSV